MRSGAIVFGRGKKLVDAKEGLKASAPNERAASISSGDTATTWSMMDDLECGAVRYMSDSGWDFDMLWVVKGNKKRSLVGSC
jgi:hypothetical protein